MTSSSNIFAVNMDKRLAILLLGLSISQLALSNDCINKPDNTIIHMACNYYVRCINQQENPTFCNKPYVYNHIKKDCDL